MALEHDHRAGALVLALSLLPVASVMSSVLQGPALVIDGDTLEIAGTRVRLAGIDAPEVDQPCATEGDVLAASSTVYRCGEEAAAALTTRIGGDPVRCEPVATDTGTVLVAVCRLDDEDLGAWMVRSGWARAYPQNASAYTAEEGLAQAALRGIWRGDFLNPWDWRRERKSETDKTQQQLRVAVAAANVRSAPSRQGRLLTTLPRGTTVRQLGQSGEWRLVKVPGGASGWVFEPLLQPLRPSGELDP
jgi:endonuclease YncB( thermonuclease family)